MITIGSEAVVSEIENIFNNDDMDVYDSIDDLIFNDPSHDDILSAFDLTTNIFDSNTNLDEISYQLAQNNVSMENDFFKKIWDFLLVILKKIADSIISFFKIVVSFFKRIVNFKSDLKNDSEEVLKDKTKLKEISDEVLNKVLSNTKSQEESISIRNEITVITPGKEDEYMKIISDLYKNDFIDEFRKISFALNNLADLPFTDKSEDLIIERIKDFEFKNNDYKDKIISIIKTLKDKRSKYLVVVDKNNGNEVIQNALNRNKYSKWGSHDILKLMDSSNCNKMLSSLNQSIKKIKQKAESISNKLQASFKQLSVILNITISFTNKLFYECFQYIKAFLSTENINTKLSKMAINVFNQKRKLAA